MSDHTNCIYSPNFKQTTTVDCEITKSFDFGGALEKVYPLLNLVFENLHLADLYSAASVNSTWERYAMEEIKKRHKASWISMLKPKPKHSKQLTQIIETSNNFKYDNITFGLVCYKYSEIRLNRYICVHTDLIHVNRTTFLEYLMTEVLPPNAEFWALSCTQVYPPVPKDGFKCSFTGLFIPEIPNIKVKNFFAPPETIEEKFKNNISEDEHIHCILVFTMCFPDKLMVKLSNLLSNHQDPNTVAVGGGVISGGVKPFQKEKGTSLIKKNSIFCIAMTQEKDKSADFDAFSLVIRQGEHDFERSLVDFKNTIYLRENSLAFRICCAAKEGKETETLIFNKIFPKTFIVGIDADGEIGCDKIASWQPEEDTAEIKKRKVVEPERCSMCHQYTTIIVVLSWGKRI